MAELIDLTGQKFGRLMVLSRLSSDSRGEARWECVCACGNQTAALGSHLRTGRTQSCGCLTREKAAERCRSVPTYGNLRHGGRHTRLYTTWTNMKTRCLNKKTKAFQWYGALGVSICPEWMSFEGFRDWALSSGYRDDLTIDRIDPFGNYCPENCRWVPKSEQRANQRRNYS